MRLPRVWLSVAGLGILVLGTAEVLPSDVDQIEENPRAEQALVAPRPPMGWNSFDAYDCALNERQFKAVVDYMAENLLEYGWEYAVIDCIWFNPAPGNWHNPDRRFGHPDLRLDTDGRPIDKLTMDKYGRLLPAVEEAELDASARTA